jgi:CRP/FNR family transcriptional regulator, cyclic AMP receptor protein
MKRLLELVLSSEETPLSKQMCETLEDLIQHNRRWHYMVEPAHTLTSAVRLDGGLLTEVSEISEDRLRLRLLPADRLGTHMSFVLITPGREIPLSGTVEAFSEDGALIKLDMLIDEYAAALQEYLTRLQMLDFVV